MFWHILILLCTTLCISACSTTNTEMANQAPLVNSYDTGLPAPDATTPLPGHSIDSTVMSTDTGVAQTFDMTLITHDMTMIPSCDNDCVTERISWSRIGGQTPYEVSYALDACRTQVVWIDTPFASNPDAHRCERIIEDCQTPDGIEFEGILRLIAQIKAQGLCNAALMYGIDSRPWDGQVFSIRYEREECLLGDPCDGTQPDCIDPPEILLEAADLLWSFGREMEQNDPSCARIADGL